MRHKKLVEYRRQQIGRMLVLGMNQYDMAKQLNVSQPTISKDCAYLDSAAAEQLKTHVQKRLPHIHLICARGIDDVLKTAWAIVSTAKNDYIKIHSLTLIHQCYITKQNLASDATMINSALELINKSKEDLKELESGALKSSGQSSEDDDTLGEIPPRLVSKETSEEKEEELI